MEVAGVVAVVVSQEAEAFPEEVVLLAGAELLVVGRLIIIILVFVSICLIL